MRGGEAPLGTTPLVEREKERQPLLDSQAYREIQLAKHGSPRLRKGKKR